MSATRLFMFVNLVIWCDKRVTIDLYPGSKRKNHELRKAIKMGVFSSTVNMEAEFKCWPAYATKIPICI